MYRFPAFVLLLFPLCSFAAEPLRAPWNKQGSVRWSGTPLKESVKRFCDIQGVSVWIDRRIDPSTPLEFEASDRVLGPLLRDLAASLDLDCCLLESVAYIGPKPAAALIPEQVRTHRRQGSPRALRRRVGLTVPFLGEPREILRELADRHGLSWQNLEIVPHDLWDESKLPEMPLDELLTLLLFGFGLGYDVLEDGTTLSVRPLPASKAVAEANESRKAPVAAATKRTNDIPLERRRFTVRIEDQPLETALKSLADRLGLELKLDKESLAGKGVAPDRRISFDVKNVGAVELFRTILKPLKLEFRLRGDTIEIR